MFLAMIILFILPWLDQSPINSLRYRGWYSRIALGIFTLSFILLSYLSTSELTPLKMTCMQALVINYFLFFSAMPIYTRYDKPLER